MTTPPAEEPDTADADPFAVAAGNASLLGIGYLLLKRQNLALATGVGTLLLVVLVLTTESVPAEILAVLWWLAMIVHGWRLAGGRRSGVRDRRARWIGIVPAVVVLLAFGLLRFDAAASSATVDDARLRGDCPAAVSTQDGVWFGPRLANAPAAARGDDTAEVCAQLADARENLDRAIAGNVGALQPAYTTLTTILVDRPGHERMVQVTVDGFVTRLPAPSACTTAAITDVFAPQPPAAPSIDRLRTSAVQLRPAALVGCGDLLLRQRSWVDSASRYRQLLTEFPRSPLAARARAGAETADAERRLPQYCRTPFGYSGAPVPGPGLNKALLPGASPDAGRLPAEWRARGIKEGALVICAAGRTRGSEVRTCPYTITSSNASIDVTYHRIAIPVQVFEFRTGRIVLDTRVEVDGASCPPTVPVTELEGLSGLISPPLFDGFDGLDGFDEPDRPLLEPRRRSTTRDVDVSDADVDAALRGALAPLVQR